MREQRLPNTIRDCVFIGIQGSPDKVYSAIAVDKDTITVGPLISKDPNRIVIQNCRFLGDCTEGRIQIDETGTLIAEGVTFAGTSSTVLLPPSPPRWVRFGRLRFAIRRLWYRLALYAARRAHAMH